MMNIKSYRFSAPCSTLNLEAMQTWLEDMALNGYLLKGSRNSGRSFDFYKIEPLPIRYRLTPVSNRVEQWNLRPGEEFVSITKAYGWEHVCSTHRFHIFRSYDENAVEIHTDPIIQTQSIRQLRQRVFKTILAWLSVPILCGLIIFVFGSTDHFLQNVITEQTGFPITIGFLILLAVIQLTVELVQLSCLYRRMKQGHPPINRKDWKKKAPFYRFYSRIRPVILCLLLLLSVMGRVAYRQQADYQDLPSEGTSLPFLAVADMAQVAEVRSAERLDDVNYMRHWSHVLSSDNYDWVEIVEVVDRDGNEGLVSISILYHELNCSWLADVLTDEYLTDAQSRGTEMDQTPQVDADAAYFYYTEQGAPGAVLRYGNTVVSVKFPRSDFDLPQLQFAYWIDALNSTMVQQISS